ncbi:MAG: flagellar hook-basal body complex protein FliE, partial [Planctomycetota bacterium]
PNPINITPVTPLRPLESTPRAAPSGQGGDDGFAALMRRQLEKVNEMQNEADDDVRKLLTGESDNMTEVFVAARKAQVAFSLLIEIRNKLVDAYEEVKNMRV